MEHLGIGEELQLARQVAQRERHRRKLDGRPRRRRDGPVDEHRHETKPPGQGLAKLVDRIVRPEEDLGDGAENDAYHDSGNAPQRHVDVILGGLDLRQHDEEIA